MKRHLFITIAAFILAVPTIWANDIYYNITQEQSVTEIQNGIQDILNNANDSDKIIVTGSKTDADAPLTLMYSHDYVVMWQAV